MRNTSYNQITLEAQHEAETIWLGLCFKFRPPQWTSQCVSASEDMSNKHREAAKRRGKKPRAAWLRWKETLLAETRTFEQKRTGGFTTIMNVGESWKKV